MLMHNPLEEKNLNEYSSLLLAYIGDAVYELLVRTQIVTAGQRRIKDIHQDAVERVRAEHQASIVRRLYDHLTKQEQDIVRRGRNVKSSPPKNADLQDYRLSTGFEALIGYLYLKGDQERLLQIFQLVTEPDKESQSGL